jgi:hypothetical protein
MPEMKYLMLIYGNQDPPFDEPTNNLDFDARRKFYGVRRALTFSRQGRFGQ